MTPTSIRLTEAEVTAIQETFKATFKPTDRLWLFGSRTDLSQKGGDIDLYIETDYQDASQIVDAKLNFLVRLKLRIGDQKIDVVIKHNDEDRLIYTIARQEGIRLV